MFNSNFIRKSSVSFKKPIGKNIAIFLLKCPIHPPGMRRRSDVSFRSVIDQDIRDHAETSSQRRDWYVNETDLFETSMSRLIGTKFKPTNLRRRNNVPIDTYVILTKSTHRRDFKAST